VTGPAHCEGEERLPRSMPGTEEKERDVSASLTKRVGFQWRRGKRGQGRHDSPAKTTLLRILETVTAVTRKSTTSGRKGKPMTRYQEAWRPFWGGRPERKNRKGKRQSLKFSRDLETLEGRFSPILDHRIHGSFLFSKSKCRASPLPKKLVALFLSFLFNLSQQKPTPPFFSAKKLFLKTLLPLGWKDTPEKGSSHCFPLFKKSFSYSFS